ncbi:MAG: VWA domain-containing protein, partial [Candidatus Limimorpha sp.]
MKKFCTNHQMKSGDGRTIDVNLRKGAVRFLMRFTLILMLFPVSHGLKAQTPPTGLNMTKNWTPTSTNGDEGYVTLEAFVTGSSVTVETHAPTDIALVLDVSGSMNDPFGNGKTRLQALKEAVSTFVDIIAADAVQHNVDHRISVVKFAKPEYYGSEESVVEGNHFSNYYNYNYTEVLLNRRNARNEAALIKSQVNSLVARGATASDYGLRKVRYLFRQIPPGETDRAKVVVMFTDGSPTHSSGFQTLVANAAITNAKEYKDAGAKVFTVGTFGPNPGNNVLNYMNYVSSNYPNAISMNNPGAIANPANFFFTANTPEQLSNVFESIAQSSSSVPVQMNQQTIVQDQIATNFALPAGTQPQYISVHVPKCTAVNTSTTPYEYTFENIIDGDTLSGGNQLFNAVTLNGDLIQVTGFNFSKMWCGLHTLPNGTTEPHGRKLVIKIPLKVEEGVWGDGLPTNGPLSLIFPNGDLANPIGAFPIPTANVIGDVWTEIVSQQPQDFDANNIDSPEDLAWFISLVNGRANYDANSTVQPCPTANGKLTADIDMSAHNWIPIGSSKVTYTGTFDGNGHVVTGLKNNASKFYKQGGNVVVYPGMFGKVGDGGVVKNVFVLESDFRAKAHDQLKIHFGILVDTLDQGAQLFNCEAAGCLAITDGGARTAPMQYNNSDLIFGGLVGLNNGTIHSSMSMARLTGFAMGGAVGENWGSLRNSFTNAVYHYLGTGDEYVGGLAGETSGTVDNCYVRFERNNTNLNAAKFGQLAGSNTGTLANSHVPAGNGNPVVHTGGGTAASNYAEASAPYLYGYDKTTGEALL